MHDRHILGLARAGRHDGAPSGRARHVERRLRFADRAGLVRLYQHRVAGAERRRALHPLGVGHQKIVTDDLHLMPDRRGETAQPVRIMLAERVLDRDDRIPVEPADQHLGHAVAVERAAVARQPVEPVRVKFRGGDIERD